MLGIRFHLTLLALGTLLMTATSQVGARTYKWVDENGTTHYSQTRPVGRKFEEVSPPGGWVSAIQTGSECATLSCRAARLEAQRIERETAREKQRDTAARAAARLPVFPTPVEETDDEKIARLVAECKARRGSDCGSDAEKRRMLLQNVDLTHAERRALRGFSPAVQRRFLLQRIPKKYRSVD